MRTFHGLLLCFSLLSLPACGGEDDDSTKPLRHIARTTGSAVALSGDERIAVAVNRAAGVVSVLSLDPRRGTEDMVTKTVELDMGADSEPWVAVIGADDNTAYVVLRRSHRVARILSLRSKPRVDKTYVDVGAEPTSIAISPTGQKLFVANWGEGTVTVVTVSPFERTEQAIDLNTSLVEQAPNVLGDIAPRAGLAHPRALAITDDGDEDDSDETLFATEFFSQTLPGAEQTAEAADSNRQGVVYSISLKTGLANDWISIAPVTETGFTDGPGNTTGCFPNQLNAAAIDGSRLYVTGMCASPRGPLGPTTDMTTGEVTSTDNFKTLVHPAVFVIDTANGVELQDERRLLTRVLWDYFAPGSAAAEDASNARMPLSPSDIAFANSASGVHRAYLSALGADAVYRLDYDALGALSGIGSPGRRHIPVKSGHAMPIGVAVSRNSTPEFALALNDGSQQLSIIDLATEAVSNIETTANTPRAQELLDSAENYGRHHFATGTGVWSYKGQAWSSCESCHPGGLSDGVIWFFARGPRRSLSVANTYEKSHSPSERGRRLLLWGANVDEIHDVEAIARGVSGGVGGIVWKYTSSNDGAPNNECRLLYDNTASKATIDQPPCGKAKYTSNVHVGLNGSLASIPVGDLCSEGEECDRSNSQDWNEMDAFIRSLRAPTAPTTLLSDSVEAGRELFERGGCANCHGGLGWTVSRQFYEPSPLNNGELPHADFKTNPDLQPTAELGLLRANSYTVPADLSVLNPPAVMGSAPFRDGPGAAAAPATTTFLYAAKTWTDDQLNCALRDVGTFPVQPFDATQMNFQGIVPEGAPAVFEYRADMKTLAQGKKGMNVPSLYGLAVGGPFFHAGNARTLEEVFDRDFFATHTHAVDPEFLNETLTRADRVTELVAFLLSIDESVEPFTIPDEYDFCAH